MVGRVQSAFTGEEWMRQWEFVYWLAHTWLGKLMRFVGTCRHGCPEGQPCFYRGRLLATAYETAKKSFEDALQECNEWAIGRFGFVYIWQQGQAAVRRLFVTGMELIAYLDELPWLLARLRQEGVAARCLVKWALTPRDQHHVTSKEFLDPLDASGLEEDVRLLADGQGITPKLDEAITGLENCPMDDIIGEGPHAKAKGIIQHAAGGSFEWCASTCRLDPNLDVVNPWCMAFDKDLQTEWDRWSSVVKVQHTERPSKLPPREVTS